MLTTYHSIGYLRALRNLARGVAIPCPCCGVPTTAHALAETSDGTTYAQVLCEPCGDQAISIESYHSELSKAREAKRS